MERLKDYRMKGGKMVKLFYSPKEIAEYFGVSSAHIYTLIKEGYIKTANGNRTGYRRWIRIEDKEFARIKKRGIPFSLPFKGGGYILIHSKEDKEKQKKNFLFKDKRW